jgi:hypothetical protein
MWKLQYIRLTDYITEDNKMAYSSHSKSIYPRGLLIKEKGIVAVLERIFNQVDQKILIWNLIPNLPLTKCAEMSKSSPTKDLGFLTDKAIFNQCSKNYQSFK